MLGYIDPGRASLAWQAIMAAFLGTLFYLKKSRTLIFKLLRRLVSGRKPPEQVITPPRPPSVGG